MRDDPDLPDESKGAHEEEPASGAEPAAEAGPVFVGSVRSLDAFASIQRLLASIDFSALQAAQRALGQTETLRKVVEAQDVIAEHFARSLDFTRIAATYEALVDTAATAQAMAAQKRWADSLAKSIDFSALNRAVASSAALDSWARTSAAFNESLRQQTELLARIADDISFKLPTIDTSRLIAALDRWIPANLRDTVALDVVATLALDEGLPLSWVPRAELVVLLIEADGPDARADILIEHRDDILDDCDIALGPIESEWAVQCRNAVAAMRAGFDGPAQSHASNIIDSIVLSLHGKDGREHAKKSAQTDLDDLPLQLAAENLSLRPLFRAFTTWYPNTGVEPPDYFARHATSHAVGQPGVFAPTSALVAVMLATSLTVQYAPSDSRPPAA